MILLLIIFIYGSSIIKILRHEWVIERLLLQGLGAKVRGQDGGQGGVMLASWYRGTGLGLGVCKLCCKLSMSVVGRGGGLGLGGV